MHVDSRVDPISNRTRGPRGGMVALLLAFFGDAGGELRAQIGTPPQFLCGKAYVFAKAVPNGNVLSGQAGSVSVSTVHFIDRIQSGANCPGGNPTVTMTANLNCTPGPSSGPTLFGPFTLVEGYTTIAINVPVPAGPARLCGLVVTARVTFGDGSILEQVADQTVCVLDAAPGNPGLPQLSIETAPGGAVMMGHPGDERTFTFTITNRRSEDFDGTLTLNLRNVADLAAIIAGPNDTRRGAFAPADPGGGDNFPIAFGPDVPAGTCVSLPAPPHETPVSLLSAPVTVGGGQTQQVVVRSRSWPLSAHGAAGESTALLQGAFVRGAGARGPAMVAAAAGVVASVNRTTAPAFACPGSSGRATTGFSSSVSGVGPSAGMLCDATAGGAQPFRLDFALQNSGFQMLINGTPISGGTNFSGITQVDGQYIRLTTEYSFITPLAPPDATITMIVPIVVQPHPSAAADTQAMVQSVATVPGAPNGSADRYPAALGRVEVNRTNPLQDAVVDFVHQMSAVGVEQGTFNPVPMTNTHLKIMPSTPITSSIPYTVESTWIATNPGTTPMVGFDVFNDFRGHARPALLCKNRAGDFNGDGAVNGADVQDYARCRITPEPGCGCADLDYNDVLNGTDTALFTEALLGNSLRFTAPFGPVAATITTDTGQQPAMVEGELWLTVGQPDAQGICAVNVEEAVVGTSSVGTSAGPSGGMTFLLRDGGASGAWNLVSGALVVPLDFDVSYRGIARNEPHQQPNAGGQNDVRQLPVEFWSGFLTATAAFGQGVQSVELDGTITVDVTESLTQTISRLSVMLDFSVPRRPPAAPGTCPEELQCKKRVICLQPVFVRDADGSNPTGSSFPIFQLAADSIWSRCCVEFDWRPPLFVDNPAYKTIESIDAPAGEAEMTMLLQEQDYDGNNECVEIFVVKQFVNAAGHRHENGDGMAFDGGMKAAQVIVADDAFDDCTPPRATVLAHEVGHALGLDTMDTNGDGEVHESGCVMAASSAVPPQCPSPNPSSVRLMQCKMLRNPLLKEKQPPEECCKDPNCD